MGYGIVKTEELSDIADAIRAKLGVQTQYKPGQMADAIESIPEDGITPTGTKEITANGTYDVTSFASAEVSVPQSGITPTGTKQVSVTQNGTTTEDVTNYASVEITANVVNADYTAALTALGVQSDLANSITALTTYANGVTGESDTTLSDAVASLASGYGGYSVRDIFMGDAPSGESVVFEPDAIVPAYAISGRRNITKLTIDASGLTSASYGGFAGRAVSHNFIPKIHLIGNGVGDVQSYMCNDNGSASSLVTIVCRGFTGVSGSAFRSNPGLKVIDLTFTGNFSGDAAFRDCTLLDTIIIRNSTVPALTNVGNFTNTPFASGKAGGTIYVPSALIDSYKAANNWNTVNGYGTITWAAIETSQYANTYADGTPISE